MKVIEWTCPQCGARHKQTTTVNEKAVYDLDDALLYVEPECGCCGYIPLIKQTGNGWEDVR